MPVGLIRRRALVQQSAMGTWPKDAARWIGASPLASLALRDTPSSSRSRTRRSCPPRMAGASPLPFAPASLRAVASGTSPRPAARTNGACSHFAQVLFGASYMTFNISSPKPFKAPWFIGTAASLRAVVLRASRRPATRLNGVFSHSGQTSSGTPFMTSRFLRPNPSKHRGSSTWLR